MIYKRGKNWGIKIYVGVDPVTKEEIYKTATSRGTREDARKLETKMQGVIDDSPMASIHIRPFQAYAREWLSQHKSEIMINTYAGYYGYIESACDRFQDMRMGDIEKHHIARYLDDLSTGLAGPAFRGKISASTKKKIFFVLRRMFFDALEGDSPMLAMKTPKSKRPAARYPNEMETNAVYEMLSGDLDMLLATVLGTYHGMRRGEIFALEWPDIRKETISITKSLKHKRGGGNDVGPPKGVESTRIITIDELTETLFDLKRKADGVLPTSGSIFPFTMDAFSSRFEKIVDKIGGDFGFHGLRHYHLTKLKSEGYSDAYVAARAGHSIKVLNEIYTHLLAKDRDTQDDRIRARRAGPEGVKFEPKSFEVEKTKKDKKKAAQ